MKTKHTPGPWSHRYLTKYGFIIENEDKGQMQFGKLADIMPRGGGESQANAALIAAAPDMLQALISAEAWVLLQKDIPGCSPASEAMLKIIRAAIQKATGAE
jgi:hypothetical protein